MNGLIIFVFGLTSGLNIADGNPFFGFVLAAMGAVWAGAHDVAVRNLVRSRSRKW